MHQHIWIAGLRHRTATFLGFRQIRADAHDASVIIAPGPRSRRYFCACRQKLFDNSRAKPAAGSSNEDSHTSIMEELARGRWAAAGVRTI